MSKHLRALQLRQIDASLALWRDANLPPAPPGGWSTAIRDGLGMSSVAFAKRLGMTSAGARRLEQSEANQTITLASLRKLAQALGCQVQYALVPPKPLATMLQQRAEQLANERLRTVGHSMALEDQAVGGAAKDVQSELLAQELLDGPRRVLWSQG